MVVNCEECEVQLEITPFGYMHPLGGKCKEDDGLRVESTTRHIFENKYGKPVRTQEQTINLLKKELKEKEITLKLLGEQQQKIMKYYNERLNKWEKTNQQQQRKLLEAFQKKKSFWDWGKNR